MAEAAVAGIFLEFAGGEALQFVKKSFIIIFFCDSVCKKFKATLDKLKPTVDDMCKLSSERSSQSWLRSIEDFQGKLGDGLQLVDKCLRTNNLNLYKKFRYAKRIQKLEKEIDSFIRIQIVPNILLELQKFPDYSSQLARIGEDMRQPDYSSQLARLSEDMRHLASKVAEDADENRLLRRQIFENPRDDPEQQNCSFSVPSMPPYVIGFDKLLANLKELALDARVNVIGITGMGGRGKSTLALALCHDHDVKGYVGIPKDSLVLKFLAICRVLWEQSNLHPRFKKP